MVEVGVGSMVGLHRVDHAGAGVASDLTEVRVLTQVHHRGRIHDAAVVAVSEGRDVALAHVFNNFQQVGLDVELGRFASGVGHAQGATGEPVSLYHRAGSNHLAPCRQLCHMLRLSGVR